jgi:rhamnulokinase
MAELITSASGIPKNSVIDVNDDKFLSPGDMPSRIKQACLETGQAVPQTDLEIVRVIFDSLAAKYLDVIDELEELTQNKIERIHIVGGGSQNELLNQLISNATGLEVFAGPVEATAIGNLVVQARAAGVIKGTLEEARSIIARSFDIKRFSPINLGEK